MTLFTVGEIGLNTVLYFNSLFTTPDSRLYSIIPSAVFSTFTFPCIANEPSCAIENSEEYFFMAGVSRVWHNLEMDQKASTFAVVTTDALGPMLQIHNTKKRMPVILPPELALEWIQQDLSEERIAELATYQCDPKKFKAWPVAKNFLHADDPTREFHYENLPPL